MLELNLKNRAVSQTTKAYNSMCRFGNQYLGCTDSGLFKVGGFDDNGTQVPALVKSGMFDLGTDRPKRFRFFYFGIEAHGSLKLSVYGDGVLAGTYTVTSAGTTPQGVRVPISRAVSARYWQWQIENIGGAFFALYKVEALPVVLRHGH